MLDLRLLLKTAVKHKASDVHIKAGAHPYVRIRGELMPMNNFHRITRQDTLDLAHNVLNTRQKEALTEHSEIDISFGGPDMGRFRLAVYHQRGSISMVFRVIPEKVPDLNELKLPEVLREIVKNKRGLILVTGATGSGKSTTLSAMVEHINRTQRTHIITIEDPIEFLLTDKLSLISQREVGVDTMSFGGALRAALRQDPDVVLVGEMRDYETVMTAMGAAETGHLVMSTLHTSDTMETVNRVISMFPSDQQNDVRYRFAASLNAVISMRLVKSSINKNRYPAVEILRNTELGRSLIEDRERHKDLRKALETGYTHYGMQTFDQSLFQLYDDHLISADDALENASFPEDLSLKIQGILSAAEQ